jgi:hypothetical protein
MPPQAKQVLSGAGVAVLGAALVALNAYVMHLTAAWQGLAFAVLAGVAHYVPALGTADKTTNDVTARVAAIAGPLAVPPALPPPQTKEQIMSALVLAAIAALETRHAELVSMLDPHHAATVKPLAASAAPAPALTAAPVAAAPEVLVSAPMRADFVSETEPAPALPVDPVVETADLLAHATPEELAEIHAYLASKKEVASVP